METGITQSIRTKVKAKNEIDAFIYLQFLSTFSEAMEERIEIIRKEKFRILNHLQFFPRIERIINKN
jgi:hypothetical protein